MQSSKEADFSICAFYESAAKNGLTATAALTDNTQYTLIGTDIMQFAHERYFGYFALRTAAIANAAEGRIKKNGWLDYVQTYQFIDQTRQLLGKSDYIRVGRPMPKNSKLNFDANNGNNAQVEMAAILVGRKPFELYNAPPEGYFPITVTATTALTGGAISDPGACTYSYDFDPDKEYHVGGMSGHSATGYMGRLVYSGKNMRPGVLVGDDNQLSAPVFGNFGSFNGDNPPTLEWLASGNDGDVYATLWIKEL